MPVKIRLMRIGAKKRPFYRVVAVDERKKRTGAYLDLLGTYNPLTEPKEIKLNQTKVDEWLKKGAQPSDGFLRIIGKAPQKPPRKAKKDKGEPNTPVEAAPTQEAEKESVEESDVNDTSTQEVIAENSTEEPEQTNSDNSETNSAEKTEN